MTKIKKVHNSRWRTDVILNFFCYNSAPYCPIKTKFEIRRLNRTHSLQRLILGDENVQFRKSNIEDGRHFENHYIVGLVYNYRNSICGRK